MIYSCKKTTHVLLKFVQIKKKKKEKGSKQTKNKTELKRHAWSDPRVVLGITWGNNAAIIISAFILTMDN